MKTHQTAGISGARYQYWTTKWLASISNMVICGRSTPKSMKIASNLGTIQYMMKPTIRTATKMTTTG